MSSIRGSTASARFFPLMVKVMFRVMAEVPAVIVARVANRGARTLQLWRTHSCVPRSHSCERLDPRPVQPSLSQSFTSM